MRYVLRCKAGNIPFVSKTEYMDAGRASFVLHQDKSCADKPYDLVVETADSDKADCFLIDNEEEVSVGTPCRIIKDKSAGDTP